MTHLTTTRAHTWAAAAVSDTRAWLSRRLTLALAALALLGGGIAAPAARAQVGNTTIRQFSGAPSGACANIQIAVNLLNGDLYDCLAGGWHLVSGAGGASTFDLIGSGVNTSATMTLGTGATLTFSGSGVNNASKIQGVAITGTPGAGQIPISTSSTAAAWGDPIIQGTQAAGSTTIPNPLVSGGSDYGGTPAIRTWKVDSAGSGHLTIDNASAIMGNCGATTVNAHQYCGNNTASNGVAPGFVVPVLSDIASSASSNAYTFNGNLTDTGNNTHSGTETFTNTVTMGKWNGIIIVDGIQFTTCDAAVTAAIAQAGSGLALVIVPSTYAGAACTTIPTNSHVQVWYFNNIDPLVQSGVFWNTTSATPVHAWLRTQMNDTSPAGNSVADFVINRVSGVIPGNSAMDALSPEVQSVGTITSVGAGTKLQASEHVVTLASTGGTWPDIRVAVFFAQDTVSNTTNATNTSAIFVPTMAKTGTGNYGTLVGAIFNKQTAGNVANWAMQSFGSSLFSFSAANEKLFISGDSFTNSNVIDIADTHAGGHTWDIGEMQNVAHLSFRDITQTGGPAWSFLVTGTTGVEGVLSHANTANRTYTFLDSSGTVAFNPPAVTGTDLGSTALPWANFWLGTAATNNFKFQPAATAAARVISMPDPLGAVNMPYVIASGTSAMTTAAVAGGACGTTVTTAATGALTTDSIEVARNAAATAANGGLLALNWWVTAGNVNFNYCNGGTVSNTPTAMTINWRVIR